MKMIKVEKILNDCRKMLVKDKKTDALTVEDMRGLHRDACVITAAIIIAEAIETSMERQ